MKFISIIFMALIFGFASSAYATKGRVNQYGCHNSKSAGQHYHHEGTRQIAGKCHKGKPVVKKSSSVEKRLIRIEKKLDKLLKSKSGSSSKMNPIKTQICQGFLRKYKEARFDSTREKIYNQMSRASCLK